MGSCESWSPPTSSPARSPRSRRPRRSPRAGGGRRRATSSTCSRCPTADRASSTSSHAALGGSLEPVVVRGPLGEPVPAELLRVGDTAYVESAQACGLHLTGGRDAERATTYGVGELRRGRTEPPAPAPSWSGWAAAAPTTAAPGCSPRSARPPTVPSTRASPGSPASPASTSPTSGRRAGRGERRRQPADRPVRRHQDVRPAEGDPRGAAAGGGRAARGARARRRAADGPREGSRRRRRDWATRCCCSERDAQSGLELVAEATDLAARARKADLVVTGEGAFDFSSRAGKVPYGVASVAAEAIRPCVALAGQVLVGSREMRALGIESAYSLVELVGEERAFAEPAGGAGATWPRGWPGPGRT